MKDWKKILCPTDFSEPSHKAIRLGAEIASTVSAQLILLHVVSPLNVAPSALPIQEGPSGFNAHRIQLELSRGAESALEELAGNMDVPASWEVRNGIVAEEIVEAARRHDADVIVIATHGLTGWRRFVFGSVTDKVLHLTSRPVLTIPAEPEGE